MSTIEGDAEMAKNLMNKLVCCLNKNHIVSYPFQTLLCGAIACKYCISKANIDKIIYCYHCEHHHNCEEILLKIERNEKSEKVSEAVLNNYIPVAFNTIYNFLIEKIGRIFYVSKDDIFSDKPLNPIDYEKMTKIILLNCMKRVEARKNDLSLQIRSNAFNLKKNHAEYINNFLRVATQYYRECEKLKDELNLLNDEYGKIINERQAKYDELYIILNNEAPMMRGDTHKPMKRYGSFFNKNKPKTNETESTYKSYSSINAELNRLRESQSFNENKFIKNDRSRVHSQDADVKKPIGETISRENVQSKISEINAQCSNTDDDCDEVFEINASSADKNKILDKVKKFGFAYHLPNTKSTINRHSAFIPETNKQSTLRDEDKSLTGSSQSLFRKFSDPTGEDNRKSYKKINELKGNNEQSSNQKSTIKDKFKRISNVLSSPFKKDGVVSDSSSTTIVTAKLPKMDVPTTSGQSSLITVLDDDDDDKKSRSNWNVAPTDNNRATNIPEAHSMENNLNKIKTYQFDDLSDIYEVSENSSKLDSQGSLKFIDMEIKSAASNEAKNLNKNKYLIIPSNLSDLSSSEEALTNFKPKNLTSSPKSPQFSSSIIKTSTITSEYDNVVPATPSKNLKADEQIIAEKPPRQPRAYGGTKRTTSKITNEENREQSLDRNKSRQMDISPSNKQTNTPLPPGPSYKFAAIRRNTTNITNSEEQNNDRNRRRLMDTSPTNTQSASNINIQNKSSIMSVDDNTPFILPSPDKTIQITRPPKNPVINKSNSQILDSNKYQNVPINQTSSSNFIQNTPTTTSSSPFFFNISPFQTVPVSKNSTPVTYSNQNQQITSSANSRSQINQNVDSNIYKQFEHVRRDLEMAKESLIEKKINLFFKYQNTIRKLKRALKDLNDARAMSFKPSLYDYTHMSFGKLNVPLKLTTQTKSKYEINDKNLFIALSKNENIAILKNPARWTYHYVYQNALKNERDISHFLGFVCADYGNDFVFAEANTNYAYHTKFNIMQKRLEVVNRIDINCQPLYMAINTRAYEYNELYVIPNQVNNFVILLFSLNSCKYKAIIHANNPTFLAFTETLIYVKVLNGISTYSKRNLLKLYHIEINFGLEFSSLIITKPFNILTSAILASQIDHSQSTKSIVGKASALFGVNNDNRNKHNRYLCCYDMFGNLEQGALLTQHKISHIFATNICNDKYLYTYEDKSRNTIVKCGKIYRNF